LTNWTKVTFLRANPHNNFCQLLDALCDVENYIKALQPPSL